MVARDILPALFALASLVGLACAHENHIHPAAKPGVDSDHPALVKENGGKTGSDSSLGGVLFPTVNFSLGFGTSTGDPEELAVGHHDPNRKGLTFQNIEFGASLRAGEYLEGFITYAAVIDHGDDWSGSVEEVYGKFKNLPGSFELRGGRYYNRFGFYNSVHPHDYMFVNRDLLEARMLGEDAVTTEGGELAWHLPDGHQWKGAISLSYGRAFLEHEEEEEEGGKLFSPDGAYLSDEIFSVDMRVVYDHDDFHQWKGIASFMMGDNHFGRRTHVYGLGLEYLWRETGFEPGGRSFRWRTEAMCRNAGAASTARSGEPVSHRQLDEAGVSTAAIYGFNDKFLTGVNLAYVEGIGEAGLNERYRVSPLVQWNLLPNVNLRLQYDYDHASDFGGEHSVWMQFNFSWGEAEVH